MQPLASSADVVIIGSGITGASIARTLLQNRVRSASSTSHPAVVILEARDICSGATGRNGGHILETADDYAELADEYGEGVARKTMRFRLSHLREMLGVAKEFGLTEETQARKVQFLSAFFGDQPWKDALERLQRFKEGMPEESAEWVSYDRESMPEVSFLQWSLHLEPTDSCNDRSLSSRTQLVLLQVLRVPYGLINSSQVYWLDFSQTI
jgi:glycine/D-amino acid oxidase-like deaminating enzyme